MRDITPTPESDHIAGFYESCSEDENEAKQAKISLNLLLPLVPSSFFDTHLPEGLLASVISRGAKKLHVRPRRLTPRGPASPARQTGGGDVACLAV